MKNKIFVTVFALLLAVISLANLFAPKKDFSENENRSLAVFPELSMESLKDGSFTSGFAAYLSDHFLFRDAWVSIKSAAESVMLKTSNNGVFHGRNGYLIDGFDEDSASGFDGNLEEVKNFVRMMKTDFGIDVRTVIAPNAAQILSEKLPRFAVTADGRSLSEKAANELDGFVDVYDAMDSHKNDYIYYRTDHHWTYLGAYYAYAEYKKSLGQTADLLESMDIETVSDRFFGTTYSRFGFFNGRNADTLSAPSETHLGSMTVTNSKAETFSSIYFPDALDGKDKYMYFLGGNDSIVTVETENKNGKTLLLIKDSYANSFLPYLIGDYEKIILLDMRYYQGVVPELIGQSGVTDILILYNLKSFSEDNYIRFINFTE